MPQSLFILYIAAINIKSFRGGENIRQLKLTFSSQTKVEGYNSHKKS